MTEAAHMDFENLLCPFSSLVRPNSKYLWFHVVLLLTVRGAFLCKLHYSVHSLTSLFLALLSPHLGFLSVSCAGREGGAGAGFPTV